MNPPAMPAGEDRPPRGSRRTPRAEGGGASGRTTVIPCPPEKFALAGSGSYNGQADATWAISGQVNGNRISYTIKYTGTLSPGYTITATGTIAADGSASGTATSSQGQVLTWAEGPGAFASVLHYVAPVSSVHVKTGHDATFQFTIGAARPAPRRGG